MRRGASDSEEPDGGSLDCRYERVGWEGDKCRKKAAETGRKLAGRTGCLGHFTGGQVVPK